MKRRTENKKVQVEGLFSFDPGVVSDFYINAQKTKNIVPAWR